MALDPKAPGRLKRTAEFPTTGPASTASPRPVVIVLDDDPEICDAFKEALDEAGFETICLPNGEEGLQHLAHHPAPAVILLDLMMPVMDGWTFVKRVQASVQFQDIPLIITTAAGPHWGYPATPVLRKPINRHDLVGAVRSVIQGPGSATGTR